MNRKLSSMWRVAIALVLALSLSLVMAVPVAADVSDIDVTPNPATAGTAAAYEVEFTTTVELPTTTGKVHIKFPADTYIAGYNGTATIGGKSATATASGQTLEITLTGDPVGAGSVTVSLDKNSTNIINPPAGDYTLEVWTSVETTHVLSKSYTITPLPPSYLEVTGDATMTAGAENELTVTAYDATDMVETSYTGSKTLVFSGPAVAPDGTTPTVEGVTMGNEVTVTFTEGVSVTGSATLTAYNVQTVDVDVADGAIVSGDRDLDLTVTAGAAAQLAYTAEPLTVIAGAEAQFTVQRRDPYANPVTPATTTVVGLDSDSTGAAKEFRAITGVSSVTSVTIPAASHSVNFYYYDELAGDWTITASASGLDSAESALTVSPAAIDSYTVSEITSPQKTHTAFGVTIQAQDEFNNDITSGDNAVDEVTITYTPADAPATPDSTTTAKGTKTVNVTLTAIKLGQTITFTSGDDGTKTGVSNPFQVIVGGPVHNTTQDTYFDTIQEAIDAAVAGDTINVAAGAYTIGAAEQITIDKQLTLKGANYGVNPITGTRVAESIIDGTAVADPIEEVVNITAGNVILDGFTIFGDADGMAGASVVSYRTPALSASGELSNNIIYGSKWGIHTRTDGAPSNLVISNNTVAATATGTAVYLDSGEGAQITGNLITAGGITLTGAPANTTIENNTINNTNTGGTGVMLAMAADGVTITGNTFSGPITDGNGVKIDASATKVSTFAIHQNNFISDFTAGTGLAVNNLTQSQVDATNNWWGQATAPVVGDGAADQVSVLVTYAPYLTEPYTYAAPVAPVTTIELSVGWNLISLMLIPEDSTIGVVLDGVDVDKVAGYSPFQEWKLYDPGVSAVLSDMDDGWGYWVDMNTADTLIVSGYETCEPVPATPPTYNVVVGWNLIGFKSTTSKPIEDYLGPAIAGTLEAIYGYNASTGVYFIPLTNLEPGYGYWLAVNATGTIYP